MTTTRKGRSRGHPLPEEIKVLERHTQALDRFRRALFGLDRQDRIELARRIMAANESPRGRRPRRMAAAS